MQDFREKNTDHMRPDIVALLRSSKSAFICGMIGIDPVAVFRWAVLRAFFRAVITFREAGKRHIRRKSGKQQVLLYCNIIITLLYLILSFFFLPCFPQQRQFYSILFSYHIAMSRWTCNELSKFNSVKTSGYNQIVYALAYFH